MPRSVKSPLAGRGDFSITKMKPTLIKLCDCGNVATIIKNSDRICIRCFNADQNRYKVERRAKRTSVSFGPVDTYNVALAHWG